MTVDTYEGCVYGRSPDDPHYKISAVDLESIRMQLPGLPIRVEHEQNTIGSVIASVIDANGRLNVTYALSDNAAGWAAAQLINQGDLPELSLNHTEYGDGRKVPKEVSLVVKGARPDTQIFRNRANDLFSGAEYKNKVPYTEHKEAHPKHSVASMSDSMAETPQATASAEVVVPSADPTGGDQGTKLEHFKANNSEPDHADILQDLTSKLDVASAEKLYASYGHLMQQVIESRNTMANLQNANNIMEKASERQKEMAKHTAQDVTRVLNDLYKTYGPPGTQITPEEKSIVEKSMVENPSFMNALQPLVVAASAITRRQSELENQQFNKTLLQKQAEISVLQRQMHLHSQMGAHVDATDLWKPMPAAAVVEHPAPAMIEVAASGKRKAPDGSVNVIPAWLQDQIGCYASGFQQNRMYKSDFNTNIRTHTQQ